VAVELAEVSSGLIQANLHAEKWRAFSHWFSQNCVRHSLIGGTDSPIYG